jgi:hypothetical protein
MGFMSEALTEKDTEFLSSFKFSPPIGGTKNKLAKIPRMAAVDRERNIYLFCLGGQGFSNSEEYPPDYYMLIWGDSAIEIEAYWESSGNTKVGVEIWWNIRSVFAASSLKSINPPKIQELIREAFTAYGNVWFRNSVVTTNFIHIATPGFSK